MTVAVAEAGCRLQANFVDNKQVVLDQGEVTSLQLWMSNTGIEPIGELWLVVGPDNLWVDEGEEEVPLVSSEANYSIYLLICLAYR